MLLNEFGLSILLVLFLAFAAFLGGELALLGNAAAFLEDCLDGVEDVVNGEARVGDGGGRLLLPDQVRVHGQPGPDATAELLPQGAGGGFLDGLAGKHLLGEGAVPGPDGAVGEELVGLEEGGAAGVLDEEDGDVDGAAAGGGEGGVAVGELDPEVVEGL